MGREVVVTVWRGWCASRRPPLEETVIRCFLGGRNCSSVGGWPGGQRGMTEVKAVEGAGMVPACGGRMHAIGA